MYKLADYSRFSFHFAFHYHFQKKNGKWREVLIDFDDGVNNEIKLRYVLSPGDTYASSIFLKHTVSPCYFILLSSQPYC